MLIPATGFYDGKAPDGKQPYRFRRKDLEPFAFAGIWEFVRHDPALMEAYAVNRAVNSVKNDTEECIAPAADLRL